MRLDTHCIAYIHRNDMLHNSNLMLQSAFRMHIVLLTYTVTTCNTTVT